MVLKVDKMTEAEKTVLVAAGENETVTFTVIRDVPGVYGMLVNGLTGSFTVMAPPPLLPEPAAFTVSGLTIHPAEISPGEVVTIGVTVTNVGATEDSYTVVLKINDVKEDEKSVTLDAGQRQGVSFSVSRDVPGSHTVIVDGLSGSFTVLTPPEVPSVKPPVNWPLIGGIIAAVMVIGVVIFLVLRKRAKTQRA